MSQTPPTNKSLPVLFDRLSQVVADIVAHPETHWSIRNPLMELTSHLIDYYANEPVDRSAAIKFSMPRALRKAQAQPEEEAK